MTSLATLTAGYLAIVFSLAITGVLLYWGFQAAIELYDKFSLAKSRHEQRQIELDELDRKGRL